MGAVSLEPTLDRSGIAWAQGIVSQHHYLRRPVDARTSIEGYALNISDLGRMGLMLFGRPEATRCYPWYGSVEDAQIGRAEVTRWQVLNLSRVWLDPRIQSGGEFYSPKWLPGFVDRRGVWRSTVASTMIKLAIRSIEFDYLVRRPPCFLDEPYQIEWLMSYCDTRLHRGVIYAASGFERYRINKHGVETWRIRLPALTPGQDEIVRRIAEQHPRSRMYRARRAGQASQARMAF